MILRAIAALFLFGCALHAGSRHFPVSDIPASMRSAAIVVREHSTSFDATDDPQRLTVTLVMTVFNRTEAENAHLLLYYDRFSSVEELEGTVYDAAGEEVRDLDEDEDVFDVSVSDEGTFHGDNRVKRVLMTHPAVPYTVAYTYEIEYSESFHWPVWVAQERGYPVQLSSFTVTLPKGESLRFWSNTDSLPPAVTTVDSRTTYRWSVEGLPEMSREEKNADALDVTPVVRTAPSTFSVEGYSGEMTTWKGFGAWYHSLLKGRQTLPPDAQKKIAEVSSASADARGRIRALYTYLQEHMRYVSIQLGLGSWQPFDAAFVHERSYGDCKALTNYMQTILSYSGIPSHQALIRAGTARHPLITSFPSNQFNHVILCVPNSGDTVWLECTSRSIPFGMLGDFTEDRECLLITPEGGVIVRTPGTSPEANQQRTAATVTLRTDGTALLRGGIEFTGDQSIDIKGALASKPLKERTEWLVNRLNVPNVSLTSSAFEGLDDRMPEVSVTFNAAVTRSATITQQRLFILPSLINRTTYIPAEKKNRRWPIRLAYPYRDADSILIRFPNGYAAESLPPELLLNAPFGSFRSTTTPLGDTAVVYHRELIIRDKEIPVTQYEEYRGFYQKIVLGDRTKLVLKRKE